METIACDKCGHEQRLVPHTAKMKDGVERVYLVCEACKEQYTAYYTDRTIREIQARQRRIAKKISRMTGKPRPEVYQKLYDEFQDNKQKLLIMTFELRRLMEAGESRIPPGAKV